MYYIGQQIVLEGSPSFYHEEAATGPTYDSSAPSAYDPPKSSFIVISFILPAMVALFAFLSYLFRPLFYYRPRWTKPFIIESFEQQDDFLLKSKKDHWLALLIILLASVAGLTLQTITSCLFQWHFASHFLCVSWAIGTFLFIIDRPKSAPLALLMLYLSIVASKSMAIIDQQHPTPQLSILETPSLILALIIVIFILMMPLRDYRLSNEGINPAFDIPNPDSRSPEDNLTLWQFMTVSWMKPLISIGNKRQLNDEDVWGLPYEFRHRRLHHAFRDLRGSVVRRLLCANGIDLVILTALGLLELVANYSVPVLLQQILSSMEDIRSPNRIAMSYALLSLVVRQIAAQSAVFSYWFSRRCYERSRGEMITMLYEKTLSRKIVGLIQGQSQKIAPRDKSLEDHSCGGRRLFFKRFLRSINVWFCSKTHTFKQRQEKDLVRKNASMGKILNIMRNDVYEVAQRFWEFQMLINRPLGLILSIVLIWKLIGWPCLIGILTVVSAQCINALVARILLGQEKKRRAATDSKTHKITQFVESIRHLRWYGWQKAWLDRILETRKHELDLRVITGLLGILINFVNSLASGMFPVAAFYAYTALAGLPLRIDLAFPALQLFTMLETNMRDIPNLITVLINASVAVERIEDFMSEPNKEDSVRSALPSEDLGLKNATFAWPGSQHIVLLDVTLSFPVGLTVIRGRVGAGKTALLQALLGELDLVDGGLIRPNQVVGFCAQSPWLQSMSIRENILFHTPYEESRYKYVLDACALIPDLAGFKDGDLSNLGDNGVGLSGGQRARVALARAVYSKAEILLLDDPLSALDHETANDIVHKCLLGPITKGRIVVLVTHRTGLCEEYASQVIDVLGPDVCMVRNGFSDVAGDAIGKRAEFDEQVVKSVADERLANDTAPDKFIEDEHRAHGGVRASVYWEYIKAGQLKWWVVLICFVSIYRVIAVGESWFLKQWAEAYGRTRQSIASLSGFFSNLPSPEVNIRPWLLGFFLIALAQSVMFLVSQAFMVVIVYCAGRQMFKHIMHRVSHSTFRFFDITPMGRLMNRMTSDMNTIDGHISFQLQNVAWLSITWVSSVVVIAAVTPIFLVFSLALTLAFIMIFLRFLPTSQSLRRLEMVSLSPLMSNFGALVDGLTTVRAFRVQERFQDRVIAVTDNFQKMDHFYWSLQAWLMFRFDSLSACSTFFLTLLSIYTNVSPGLTAFVLVAASQFVTSTHSLCKQYGQLQMDFVSVERVVELLHLEQEPAGDIEPPAAWPTFSGAIVFEDVTVRYAPHFDPALSDISFTIKGGSNTAIVGRTGSGKSTLALSLLATIHPCKGRILIDNVDISKVNKEALRSRVTFVAQDPVLFPGTIRKNLDPISEHTDSECETVLAKICGERGYGWSLDTEVDTGGSNLSQGQRQLIGLARAILRRSAVIVMDEATASIDLETASRIQKILREEMSGRTIVTIAHRIEAVEHADHFIVLGNGRVIEEGAVFR